MNISRQLTLVLNLIKIAVLIISLQNHMLIKHIPNPHLYHNLQSPLDFFHRLCFIYHNL